MKYVCTICGYIYDEAAGALESRIPPNTPWDALPSDWVCPICGAPKDVFEKAEEEASAAVKDEPLTSFDASWDQLALSALCSNLAKGCEKQYLAEEAALYNKLAAYFETKAVPKEGNVQDLLNQVEQDLKELYPAAKQAADDAYDRGAKRILVWSEKVKRIQESLLKRYETEQQNLIKDTKVYVCEICGFIYVGDTPPEVCPVCKVPSFKLVEVERG